MHTAICLNEPPERGTNLDQSSPSQLAMIESLRRRLSLVAIKSLKTLLSALGSAGRPDGSVGLVWFGLKKLFSTWVQVWGWSWVLVTILPAICVCVSV